VGLALCDAYSGDRKGKIVHDPRRPAEEFHARLPAEVRWRADNYNNLTEQPTLFYGVSLSLALLGAGEGLNTGLAWIHVGLRVLHSLVQATANIIMVRFAVFMAASLLLLAMSVRAVLCSRGMDHVTHWRHLRWIGDIVGFPRQDELPGLQAEEHHAGKKQGRDLRWP
jgi:hypothetical protein